LVRVLIDATAIPADRGGVGRYLDGLLAGLVGPGGAGAEVSVVCQGPTTRTSPARRAQHSGPASLERRPVRLAWEQVGLPRLARRRRVDVLHCPHYTQPARPAVPTVVTHPRRDVLHHPQLHSPVKARFFRTATRFAAKRAAGLVVPSAATRDELGRLVGVPAQRVTVAPHGVDRVTFHPPSDADVATLRRSLELDDRPTSRSSAPSNPARTCPT